MIDDKINEIDKLLDDDSLLNDYVSMIDNSNVEIPSGLESRILNGIKVRRINKQYQSNKFVDILKIVACTVVAICIWNSSIPSNICYATSKNIKRSDVYTKFDSVISDINAFFMTPIKLERREK
ncbi:MAG: hypothetical protein Q4D02_04885 [Clostridia bacterium]|nr:hypothetical protein [Clostridia bacterium]